MKVLVCGGRKYSDYNTVSEVLDAQIFEHFGDYPYQNVTIIQGEAKGADKLGKLFAQARSCDLESYPADWDKYGKSAGFIRNKQMLEEGKPDLVVAFPGGKGTQMMVDIAVKAGVKIVLVQE